MGTPEVSQRYQDMPPYPPRIIEELARDFGKDPAKCFRLHLGDTHYTPLPEPMASSMIEAIKDNKVHYTPSLGLPQLRERIAQYYKDTYNMRVDPEQVVIDVGSTLGISLTCSMFLNPGDYALVVNPAYPAYFGAIANANGEPIKVPTKLKDGFRLTDLNMDSFLEDKLKELEIDSNKVKMLILNNPNNPTGQYESYGQILEIARFTDKHGIMVLSDEAYLDIVFDPYSNDGDGKATTFLAATGSEHAISMGTFSKNWGCTGLRVGWRTIPKKYMDAMKRAQPQIFLSPPEPNQYAAIAAFDTPQEWHDKNLDLLKKNRDMVLKYSNEAGIEVPENIIARAALYQILPTNNIYLKLRNGKSRKADSKHIAMNAIRKELLLTSGLGFGVGADEDFIRISLCLSREELKVGLERLVELMHEDYEVRD